LLKKDEREFWPLCRFALKLVWSSSSLEYWEGKGTLVLLSPRTSRSFMLPKLLPKRVKSWLTYFLATDKAMASIPTAWWRSRLGPCSPCKSFQVGLSWIRVRSQICIY
jgi:hypothetical protein